MTVEQPTKPSAAADDDRPKATQVAERVSSEASDVTSTAVEGAREVASEVAGQARIVASEARQSFDQFLNRTRDEARSQAEQRNEQAVNRLRELSEQLTALSEGRTEGAGPLAGYLRDATSRVQGLASRLEQRGPQGVMDDVTSFARRRPGVFLAAAVGAGFLAGRAVRAGVSAQQDGGTSAGSGGAAASALVSEEFRQ